MIKILRLGHRLGRDDRISTHCGLVARALGADEIIYTGELGKEMLESVKNISQRWGGNTDSTKREESQTPNSS